MEYPCIKCPNFTKWTEKITYDLVNDKVYLKICHYAIIVITTDFLTDKEKLKIEILKEKSKNNPEILSKRYFVIRQRIYESGESELKKNCLDTLPIDENIDSHCPFSLEITMISWNFKKN